ncbi:MAG: biotin/lipoate A/B protein ligase family protein [Candidatus Bathyarchaeota archaeon]|nr:biotin/lipoate A/B protein ligase family protein [Candidatus Bathyarchaeota archaeon]
MNGWRLLKVETHDAYINMAIDEAILTAKIGNLVPSTLRFYQWKPSAVTIGKFQNIQNEVYVENCKTVGVDIVRRITGGGTVFHDAEGEITYSVVASKEELQARDIAEVYARIYAALAEALRALNIQADFNEGNAKTCPNLTVKGRKISGSAQSHKAGVFLQHGTLLINANLEKMFTLLRVPWAKTCMEVVNVAKHKITSIEQELNKDVTTEEAQQALIKGFEKALGIRLIDGTLTPYERELAERLCKEKYSTDEWNFHAEIRM